MTPSPSEERNWSQSGPSYCSVCTCGERSKHFIEDTMNLVLLFSSLKFLEFWPGTGVGKLFMQRATLEQRCSKGPHTVITE